MYLQWMYFKFAYYSIIKIDHNAENPLRKCFIVKFDKTIFKRITVQGEEIK